MLSPINTPRRDVITPSLAVVGAAICAYAVGSLVGAVYGWASLALSLTLAAATVTGSPYHRCARCTRLPHGVIRWWGRCNGLAVLLLVHALIPAATAALVLSGIPWPHALGAVAANTLAQLCALWSGSAAHDNHCGGPR